MKAELRSLETPEGESLQSVIPQGDEFCVSLYALIGAEGETGEEIFQFEVCSPDWLAQELDSYPAVWGHRRLVMMRFDPEVIESQVRKRLRHAVGEDWKEIAGKIGQWATWEFENYSR